MNDKPVCVTCSYWRDYRVGMEADPRYDGWCGWNGTFTLQTECCDHCKTGSENFISGLFLCGQDNSSPIERPARFQNSGETDALDVVIRAFEAQQEQNGTLSPEICAEALYFLREYRDSRHAVFPPTEKNIVAYAGKLPIIRLGDHYYAVRKYLPREDHWLLFHMEYWGNDVMGYRWVHADDDDYIFDRTGSLVRKEI